MPTLHYIANYILAFMCEAALAYSASLNFKNSTLNSNSYCLTFRSVTGRLDISTVTDFGIFCLTCSLVVLLDRIYKILTFDRGFVFHHDNIEHTIQNLERVFKTSVITNKSSNFPIRINKHALLGVSSSFPSTNFTLQAFADAIIALVSIDVTAFILFFDSLCFIFFLLLEIFCSSI